MVKKKKKSINNQELKGREKSLGTIMGEIKDSKDMSGVNVRDAAAEMGKDLDLALKEGVVKGLKAFNGDFYLQVLFKHHKQLGKVFAFLINARETCPRPGYSECVYKYFKSSKKFEILWALPPESICIKYMKGMIDDGKNTQNLQWVVEHETGVLARKYQDIRDAENKILQKVR